MEAQHGGWPASDIGEQPANRSSQPRQTARCALSARIFHTLNDDTDRLIRCFMPTML